MYIVQMYIYSAKATIVGVHQLQRACCSFSFSTGVITQL